MDIDRLYDQAAHPLDPTLKGILLAESRSSGNPDARRATYRTNRNNVALRTTSIPYVVDHVINDDSGLWVREYRPNDEDVLLPAMVYMHGGGWMLGGVDTHDTLCRFVADHSKASVFSVEYRLAPESPFPAANDDAVSAVRWVSEHVNELRVDPRQIGVGGDNAGGNLAIHAALRSPVAMAFAALLYPVTDLRMGTDSYRRHSEGLGLTRSSMEFFAENYCDGFDRSKWQLSPLLASSLQSMPPTIVLTAGHDPLRDEGIAFAAALSEEGQSVVCVDYPRMAHGFAAMGGALLEARHALLQVAMFVRSTCDTLSAEAPEGPS